MKDTGDIVEEVLVLETALLTDLIHRLQEEVLTLWPIVLQENDHMTKSEVISVVCESPQLREKQNVTHNYYRVLITHSLYA